MTDPFRYDGQTVVITGAATGMGHETVQLLLAAGAEVHALDIAPVDTAVAAAHRVDLGDPDSVASVIGALPDRIDALFNCAGIPGGTRWSAAEVMKVNFVGLRQLTEGLLPRISANGSVTHIASIAGGGWPAHLAELLELVATTDPARATAWIDAHAELIGDGYMFSKEAVQVYTMSRSVTTVKQGVRMNSICPGVTDTKIMPDFRQAMGDAAINMTADVGIGRLAEAAEMAPALVFLGSHAAASYVNGVNLVIDGGFSAAMATNQVDFAKYF